MNDALVILFSIVDLFSSCSELLIRVARLNVYAQAKLAWPTADEKGTRALREPHAHCIIVTLAIHVAERAAPVRAKVLRDSTADYMRVKSKNLTFVYNTSEAANPASNYTDL